MGVNIVYYAPQQKGRYVTVALSADRRIHFGRRHVRVNSLKRYFLLFNVWLAAWLIFSPIRAILWSRKRFSFSQ